MLQSALLMWPQKNLHNEKKPLESSLLQRGFFTSVCLSLCLPNSDHINQLCVAGLAGQVWETNRAHRAESQTAIVSRQGLGPLVFVGHEGKVVLRSQGFLKAEWAHIRTGSPHACPKRALQGEEGGDSYRRGPREWGSPGVGLPQEGRPNSATSASPFPGSSPSCLPPHFHSH